MNAPHQCPPEFPVASENSGYLHSYQQGPQYSYEKVPEKSEEKQTEAIVNIVDSF
jgi:hypothetical protein